MNEDRVDFETMYDRYYRDVYQFALYFTNNRQEAEDITQDTFIKAIRKIDTLKDISKFKTWILTIAKFTAIDSMRKQKFVRLFPNWLIEKDNDNDNAKTMDERIIQKGDWEELQTALLNLKPHYRSLVILKGLKDLSINETASIIGCSESKVRVDYHRAIKILKNSLKSVEEGWEVKNEQIK